MIGIDQGEVISPLLWTIYYDPLLCEVNQQSHIGYTISHTWFKKLNDVINVGRASEKISSQAFMDDTNWITSSKEQTEEVLAISHDFFSFNNILVNDYKAELMTTTAITIRDSKDPHESITLPICLDAGVNRNLLTISPLKPTQSTKFLGVWISLRNNKKFVSQQVRRIIQHNCFTMKYKKITDKQLEYILCRVIGPQLEYLTQLTTFTETQCNQFSSPFRRLFKHKLRLAATAPNYITDCQFLCNSLSV